jgi:hypothetical protein
MDRMAAAEWWYNTSYHSAIKKSPFEALYGYKPTQLEEIAIPCNVSQEAEVTLQDQEVAIKELQANLQQAQHRMKKFADARRI